MKYFKLFILVLFGFISMSFTTTSYHESVKNNMVESSDEVLSYEIILKKYYDLTLNNGKSVVSFENFYNNFYDKNSDRNLYEYVLKLAHLNGTYDKVYTILYEDNLENNNSFYTLNGGGINYNDEDYILNNSSDIFSTPRYYFARKPYYKVFNYAHLKDGDIIYETDNSNYSYKQHCSLIVNTHEDSTYGSYIQTIESVKGGVQKGYLDDLRMVQYKCKILRVKNATDYQINGAIEFARGQLGKSYSYNSLRLNISNVSTSWYCSELVYASWRSVGQDVAVNGDTYIYRDCVPKKIFESTNTFELKMNGYGFLSLEIDSKKSRTWLIKITNTSNEIVEVYYNSKMCFTNDAKNWSGLIHPAHNLVNPGKHIIVSIDTNWLADAIVASYNVGDLRMITYANGLNSSNHTMNIYHNILEEKRDPYVAN